MSTLKLLWCSALTFSLTINPVLLSNTISDEFGFPDSDMMDSFFETVDANALRVSSTDIIEALQQINVITILQEDIYRLTHPLHTRDIGRLPFAFFTPFGPLKKSNIGLSFFFNHTHSMYLAKDSERLCSYLSLSQPQLLDKIQNTLTNPLLAELATELFNNPEFAVDIPKIARILSNMRVQERRTGFMVHWDHAWRKARFHLHVPLYYRERNFFLTESEKRTLEKELDSGNPAPTDPNSARQAKKDAEAFQDAHFVSDRIGLGDTYLQLGIEWINRPGLALQAGFIATIPTEVAFKKGLKGTHFPKNTTRPIFDFNVLFDLTEQPESDEVRARAFAMLANFLLGSLDTLAANLLDAKLGNNGHPGIGTFVTIHSELDTLIKRAWVPHLLMHTRASIEYLGNKKELRYFIKKNRASEFNKRSFSDTTKSDENLTFLEQELVDSFYPFIVCTRIQPGLIINATHAFRYERGRYAFTLGPDLWISTRELFDAHSLDINSAILADLEIEKGRMPHAYQLKLFGSFDISWQRPCSDWSFSVGADITVAHHGIGRDWTAYLKCESHF